MGADPAGSGDVEARRTAERQAQRAGRDRPARSVRPGWWVYSCGPDVFGSWDRVEKATAVRGETPGAGTVRLDLGTNRHREPIYVQCAPSARVFCLTAADAARVGLVGPGVRGGRS